MPGFVIPLRLDKYDFSLLPIGIHRKNVIDFANGWHTGLAALLDTLTDANAPKVAAPDPRSARHWLAEMKEGAILRTESKESLDSTWLSVVSLPPIETSRILGSEREIKVNDINRAIPWFEHEDRIVGFAKAADLVSNMSKSVMLKASTGVDSTMFVQSGATIGDKHVDAREARKRVANLVRQAWELAMEAKDLGVFEQAGGRKVFYVTPELTKGRGEGRLHRCRWPQAPQGAQRPQREEEGQLVLRRGAWCPSSTSRGGSSCAPPSSSPMTTASRSTCRRRRTACA